MRRTLLLLAKAATSVLLLYFSLRWVNASVLAGRLSRFDPSWIALALFLLTIQVAFLAVRWRTIAAACGASLAFTPALQFVHCNIFQSGAAVDGRRRRCTHMAIRAQRCWLGTCNVLCIDR